MNHHVTGPGTSDRVALEGIRSVIRNHIPQAAQFSVESSDQGNYGYWLTDIAVNGEPIGDDEFDKVYDFVADFLADLSWGSFGDRNSDSSFVVDLDTMQMVEIDPTPGEQWQVTTPAEAYATDTTYEARRAGL